MPDPDPTVYVPSFSTTTSYRYELTAAELANALGTSVDQLPHPENLNVTKVEALIQDLELGSLELTTEPVICSDCDWIWTV